MQLFQSATGSQKKLVYRQEEKEARRSSKEWWKRYWWLCNSRSSPFLRPVAFQPLVSFFVFCLFLLLKAPFSGLSGFCYLQGKGSNSNGTSPGKGERERAVEKEKVIWSVEHIPLKRGAIVHTSGCCFLLCEWRRNFEVERKEIFLNTDNCLNTMHKNLPGAWDDEVKFECLREGKSVRVNTGSHPGWQVEWDRRVGCVRGPVND